VDPLPCNIEEYAAGVTARTYNIDLGMRGQDPKAFVVLLDGVDEGAFLQVPDLNGLVLTVADDHVQFYVEQHAGHVVGVSVQRVVLPRLHVREPPDLYLVIVRRG